MIFEGMGLQEVVAILLILIVIAFHLAMLFDVLVRKKTTILLKLLWAVIVIFLPLIGPAFYYFTAHSKRVVKQP